ncbi:MAG: hypothetical protein A2622_13395 [Bdellovibrionales bacterium RIFCSPHIGHO2_01_FULL_40_29]|nr:MAG: hypothetical protein A2622_13395 [Bdellovibrionales bacterium RIFCSPHIGHO2_01_FULL_40_29]OFZ34309.1 MAG: hypothetical protein A3D17_04555 [Bdellovibrionales bacterium RIFCSPHIGHO2_02_FULL_40_15]
MRYFLLSIMLVCSIQTLAAPQVSDEDQFKSKKQMAALWSSIPFFAAGDMGQYVKTMSQDRDSVRKMFFSEMTTALNDLAEKGVPAEMMVEPLANVLMMFDQAHDIRKASDVINIDWSLENQFKAALDRQYINNDIRDNDRRLQISKGNDTQVLKIYVKLLSSTYGLGGTVDPAKLNPVLMDAMYKQIDYVSYGTFSSLGAGQFQLTYHMQGVKNGMTRQFIARGKLIEALDNLALQVFDFFQKNIYPDWEPSADSQNLEWIRMPVQSTGSGYTYAMAKAYCSSQGGRLPYSRELLLASSGGQYKQGGIEKLQSLVSYAVSDRRRLNENYVITPGHEQYTGGAIQPESLSTKKVLFWCVRGPMSRDVKVLERLWELHRQYRYKDKEIFAAVETIRFEMGDSDTDLMYFGSQFEKFERLSGIQEAKSILKAKGISL